MKPASLTLATGLSAAGRGRDSRLASRAAEESDSEACCRLWSACCQRPVADALAVEMRSGTVASPTRPGADTSASSFRSTPFVQPKPSCSGYSPPPPGGRAGHVVLLDQLAGAAIDLEVLRDPALRDRTRRAAPRRSCCRPWIAIHCNGAQPFGASHCWPVCTVVVARPCGCNSLRADGRRRPRCAWSVVASLKYSGYSVAAVMRVARRFCARQS